MIPADICFVVRPLDCFRILVMLQDKDINASEVARIIGAEESTTRHWRTGKRHPQDPHARRLVALFQLYYPNVDVPQISDGIHAEGELTHI